MILTITVKEQVHYDLLKCFLLRHLKDGYFQTRQPRQYYDIEYKVELGDFAGVNYKLPVTWDFDDRIFFNFYKQKMWYIYYMSINGYETEVIEEYFDYYPFRDKDLKDKAKFEILQDMFGDYFKLCEARGEFAEVDEFALMECLYDISNIFTKIVL